jgi:hypothetical protein
MNWEEVLDAACWALKRLFHEDKANAAIHTSEVRFSPLTFRLAEALSVQRWQADALSSAYWPYAIIQEVMAHKNQYPEDKGRIEMEQS